MPHPLPVASAPLPGPTASLIPRLARPNIQNSRTNYNKFVIPTNASLSSVKLELDVRL